MMNSQQPIGFRISYADGLFEDVEANSISVGQHGELLVVHKSEHETGIVNTKGEKQIEVTSRVVLILPAGGWARVTSIDKLGEAFKAPSAGVD